MDSNYKGFGKARHNDPHKMELFLSFGRRRCQGLRQILFEDNNTAMVPMDIGAQFLNEYSLVFSEYFFDLFNYLDEIMFKGEAPRYGPSKDPAYPSYTCISTGIDEFDFGQNIFHIDAYPYINEILCVYILSMIAPGFLLLNFYDFSFDLEMELITQEVKFLFRGFLSLFECLNFLGHFFEIFIAYSHETIFEIGSFRSDLAYGKCYGNFQYLSDRLVPLSEYTNIFRKITQFNNNTTVFTSYMYVFKSIYLVFDNHFCYLFRSNCFF